MTVARSTPAPSSVQDAHLLWRPRRIAGVTPPGSASSDSVTPQHDEGSAMYDGQGRYTVGGYAGPSERIAADTGGVNMRPPDALPLNPTPRGTAHGGVAASDPTTRRQLPWYGLLLVVALVLFGYFIGGAPIALLFAVGVALFGGLVLWVRAL